jgi:Flp pilus assembly protein TadD
MSGLLKRLFAPAAARATSVRKNAETLKERGNERLAAGDAEGAAALYRQAAALDRTYPEAFNNLGVALRQLKRPAEAEAALRQALALRPGFATACSNLADLLVAEGRHAEAEVLYRALLAAEPASAGAWLGLGEICRHADRIESALECCRKALEIDPRSALAENNLGVVLDGVGRHHEAQEHYERALALDPNQMDARWNWICSPLLAGDYKVGLPRYEQRFATGTPAERKARAELLALFGPIPRWQGEPLAEGGRLLLWTEQGVGDTLMVLRYLPEVARRWQTRPDVLCEPHLVRLVRTFDCVGKVLSKNADHPIEGYSSYRHCPMMSLPLLFGTRIDNIPGRVPYVCPPKELQQRWQERLAEAPGLQVGIVWAGNPELPSDRERSLPLMTLAPLFEIHGVRFVSLQKGEAAAQLAASGLSAADWMAECQDYLDTASLVANLDLVIAVDTSVAHLAGALGRPVWLLNRRSSEWRWLLGREDSPWYPTMRIFNQTRRGDWDAVIERVGQALAAAVAGRGLPDLGRREC